MPKKKLAKLTNSRRQMTNEQRDQCVRLYLEGFTVDFLSDFYDRHRTVVDRLIGRRGVRRGHAPRRKLHELEQPGT